LYLAQRKYPWLIHTREPDQLTGPFAQIVFCLERQDPAVATEAAGAVLTTLTEKAETSQRAAREAWQFAQAMAKTGRRRNSDGLR